MQVIRCFAIFMALFAVAATLASCSNGGSVTIEDQCRSVAMDCVKVNTVQDSTCSFAAPNSSNNKYVLQNNNKTRKIFASLTVTETLQNSNPKTNPPKQIQSYQQIFEVDPNGTTRLNCE